ncbi:UNVERIFIED_CONTAM: hypothetical protein Sradi_6798900 [Sesamum radiatum]|uniref:Uncharacterized protein n=1 Tax=Sesamum radiatum TaxID=300843 RepID=A0AAW2JTK5_SESRA
MKVCLTAKLRTLLLPRCLNDIPYFGSPPWSSRMMEEFCINLLRLLPEVFVGVRSLEVGYRLTSGLGIRGTSLGLALRSMWSDLTRHKHSDAQIRSFIKWAVNQSE